MTKVMDQTIVRQMLGGRLVKCEYCGGRCVEFKNGRGRQCSDDCRLRSAPGEEARAKEDET